MAALSVGVDEFLPDEKMARVPRLGRVAEVGLVALLVSLFQILPVVIDAPILNHSKGEGAWKWDSFGAPAVLKMLVTGELLDHDRPAVLSLLALVGALWLGWTLYRELRLPTTQWYVLSGAL